jgi:sugar/nucleoside kinase (ribokinase family)
MIDVACVGESMALVTPDPPAPLGLGGAMRLEVAGAESTVACYLAQLGLEAAWVSRVGADPLGELLLSAIGKWGVDTGFVEVDRAAPTGVFFKDPGLPATSERAGRPEGRRSSGGERAVSGGERAVSGGERPGAVECAASSNERAASGECAASDSERRASDSERRASDSERPASDSERPASSNERPAPSNERSGADAATRVYYYRAGSAASRLGPETPVPPAALTHLSGITPALSGSCAALVDRLLSERRCSFDVNYRPGLWTVNSAAPALLDLAARASIVFVGLDEAQTLWGVSSAADVRALLPRPSVLVVKDGAVGATSFHPGGTDFVPTPPVEVTEPVGAGDAFAAGYLAGLLRFFPETDRLALGHRVAAAALAVTGDVAALAARPADQPCH